jgi:hypothetical protein
MAHDERDQPDDETAATPSGAAPGDDPAVSDADLALVRALLRDVPPAAPAARSAAIAAAMAVLDEQRADDDTADVCDPVDPVAPVIPLASRRRRRAVWATGAASAAAAAIALATFAAPASQVAGPLSTRAGEPAALERVAEAHTDAATTAAATEAVPVAEVAATPTDAGDAAADSGAGAAATMSGDAATGGKATPPGGPVPEATDVARLRDLLAAMIPGPDAALPEPEGMCGPAPFGSTVEVRTEIRWQDAVALAELRREAEGTASVVVLALPGCTVVVDEPLEP